MNGFIQSGQLIAIENGNGSPCLNLKSVSPGKYENLDLKEWEKFSEKFSFTDFL